MASKDWTNSDESSFDNSQSSGNCPCHNNNNCSNFCNSQNTYYKCEESCSHTCTEKNCENFNLGVSYCNCNSFNSDPNSCTCNSYPNDQNNVSETYTYDQNQTFTEYMSQSYERDNARNKKKCPYSCSSSYCDPTTLTNCYSCNHMYQDNMYENDYEKSTCSACGSNNNVFSPRKDEYEITAKVLFGSVGAISSLKQTGKSKKNSKKK